MNDRGAAFRLLLIGAAPRLAIGAGVVVLLWAGFFWATGMLSFS